MIKYIHRDKMLLTSIQSFQRHSLYSTGDDENQKALCMHSSKYV